MADKQRNNYPMVAKDLFLFWFLREREREGERGRERKRETFLPSKDFGAFKLFRGF
jgi:hypothetical protein